MTEADIAQALRDRYGHQGGNGRRYAFAAHVRSHAGFDATRTADFVAMDLWPSRGLSLHGHEIKVSRADWLRELKEPAKAEEFIPYMNFWWLVARRHQQRTPARRAPDSADPAGRAAAGRGRGRREPPAAPRRPGARDR
jgi:hypothetical protein